MIPYTPGQNWCRYAKQYRSYMCKICTEDSGDLIQISMN